jgi:parallel beta-helix repeat protein
VIQADYYDFVDKENADVMVITHTILRTPNWQPGQGNTWETELLDQKVEQGYAIGLIEISNLDDQYEIKTELWSDECNFEFVIIIGDALRPEPEYDTADPFYTTDANWGAGNFVPMWREVAELDWTDDWVMETDQGYIDGHEGVSIGRIPADTRPEIRNYIAKASEYVDLSVNPSWAKRILFVSNDVHNNWNNSQGTTVQLGNRWVNEIVAGYFTRHYLLTSNTDLNRDTRAEEFEDKINNFEYGLINILSTSSNADNLAEWYYDDGQAGNPGYGFDNDGHYPFVLGSSCDVASFDDVVQGEQCVIEKLMFLPEAGIIGCVGLTGPGWQGICVDFATAFWETLFEDEVYNFGSLFNASLEASEDFYELENYILRNYTLLGDPTLNLPYSNIKRRWVMTAFDPHYVNSAMSVESGDTLEIEAGAEIYFIGEDNAGLTVEDGGVLLAQGTECAPIIMSRGADEMWEGIEFETSASANGSIIEYVNIDNASIGVKVVGQPSSTNPLTISNCDISDCQYGIYANNSYLTIENCTITDCMDDAVGADEGKGVYLVNCSAGMVTIDGNTITGNGLDETFSSAGIYLSYSSPEIINNTIEDNTGTGISCFSSTPDLDASATVGTNFNTIQSNGDAIQSGSDGSEIYLAYDSYPNIKKNNIIDYDPILMTPIGYMIYKDGTTCLSSVTADYNWWGAVPTNDFFYWGSGSSITYTPAEVSEITSDLDDYELAMRFWNEGEYERAARLFIQTANDTGAIGINSIHYLFGCQLKMREPNLRAFREVLQNIASNHTDPKVAKVTRRFATHCLTMQGEYNDALNEYENRQANADCLADSILAVVDYLAVCELAGEQINRNHGASFEEEDIPKMISDLLSMKADISAFNLVTIPNEYSLEPAYPNPFNSVTHIRYGLPEVSYTKMVVYDIQGRELEILINEQNEAGYHSIMWDGSRFASGVYFYRIQSGTFTKTRKVTLLK